MGGCRREDVSVISLTADQYSRVDMYHYLSNRLTTFIGAKGASYHKQR